MAEFFGFLRIRNKMQQNNLSHTKIHYKNKILEKLFYRFFLYLS